MLSYQHLYHAGNMADVHKHALLAWVLDYLAQKDKPLSYLESHAGRGLYHLDAPEALKTGEAAQGITRAEAAGWFAPDHPYARVLAATRARFGASAYPGSPLIAAQLLRPQDSLQMAELHPQEFTALADALLPFAAIALKQDGMAMALAKTPPTPRRGLLLIDPSYEVKTDYDAMTSLIAAVHRKWNVGVILLWYPLLPGAPHAPMLAALEQANYPGALRHEVRFGAARDGHRMTGSGIFAINAPWGIEDRSRAADRALRQGRLRRPTRQLSASPLKRAPSGSTGSEPPCRS